MAVVDEPPESVPLVANPGQGAAAPSTETQTVQPIDTDASNGSPQAYLGPLDVATTVAAVTADQNPIHTPTPAPRKIEKTDSDPKVGGVVGAALKAAKAARGRIEAKAQAEARAAMAPETSKQYPGPGSAERSVSHGSRQRYCLNVALHVKEESREAFLDCIAQNQRGTLRSEVDCHQYSWGEDSATRNSFYFHEAYTHRGGFEDHCDTPHFEVWENFASQDPSPFSQPPQVAVSPTLT